MRRILRAESVFSLSVIAYLLTGCGETNGNAVLQCLYEDKWRTIVNYQLTSSKSSGASSIASDADGNLFVAGYGTGDTAKSWIVQKSEDRGRSWKVVDTFQHTKDKDSGDAGMGLLTAVSGTVYTVGDVLGSDGTSRLIIRKGTAHGTSWTTLDDLSNATAGRGLVRDWSGSLFSVGTDSGGASMIVRKSTNDGASWVNIDSFSLSNGTSAAGYGIAVTPSGTIYAVGMSFSSTGVGHWIVRKTSDGGVSWTTSDDYQLASSRNSSASFVHISSSGVIYVAGYGLDSSGVRHWIVRKTADDGKTWTMSEGYQLATDKMAEAVSISEDAEGNIFVAGTANDVNDKNHWVVRKTTNGGTSWVPSDQFQWAKNEAATPNGMGLDRSGNLYAVGEADDSNGVKHWIVRVLGCN